MFSGISFEGVCIQCDTLMFEYNFEALSPKKILAEDQNLYSGRYNMVIGMKNRGIQGKK
jgi:hypothetical protein